MEREPDLSEDTEPQDEPSTDELDQDPAYGGDSPVDDLQGG